MSDVVISKEGFHLIRSPASSLIGDENCRSAKVAKPVSFQGFAVIFSAFTVKESS